MTIDDDRLASMSPQRRALFERLQASRAGKASGGQASPIVPLRPGQGPGRLVLLHPSGGALFCYTPLIRALRPDIDVIGVTADPANDDLDFRTRMVVVASRTLAALGDMLDPAQCVLSGWSHGGALAFEIARQHAEATGKHPSVVLLDCAYYGNGPIEAESIALRNFVYDLSRLAGISRAKVNGVLDGADAASVGLRGLLERAGVSIDMTDAELAGRYRMFRACSACLGQYRPAGTFAGPVTMIAAPPEIESKDEIWHAVSTGPYRAILLPGDHYTLFNPDILPILVSAIHEAVDAMLARGDDPPEPPDAMAATRRWS
jgi:thioesterase domain-containing protein